MNIIASIVCLVAVGVVLYGSPIPGRHRPRSGLDGHLEHALAQAVDAAAMLPFLASPMQVLGAGVVMIGLAAVLETAERWIPGRSGRLTHFLASGAGVIPPLGIGLVLDFAKS